MTYTAEQPDTSENKKPEAGKYSPDVIAKAEGYMQSGLASIFFPGFDPEKEGERDMPLTLWVTSKKPFSETFREIIQADRVLVHRFIEGGEEEKEEVLQEIKIKIEEALANEPASEETKKAA